MLACYTSMFWAFHKLLNMVWIYEVNVRLIGIFKVVSAVFFLEKTQGSGMG